MLHHQESKFAHSETSQLLWCLFSIFIDFFSVTVRMCNNFDDVTALFIYQQQEEEGKIFSY